MALQSDALNRIEGLWSKLIKEIETRFLIQHRSPNITISITQEDISNKKLWQIRLIDGRIMIPEASLNSPFLTAVIAREALNITLPLCISNIPQSFDLAAHFGRQYLQDKAMIDNWSRLWESESPPVTMPSSFIYHPVMRLEDLFKLGGENAFDELMQRLYRMDKYRISLSFEDYAHYLYLFITEYNIPLTATEARVVELLLREPNLTRTAVAKRLKKSTTWVSTVIPNLLDRGILTHFERVSLVHVGVRIFNIVMFSNDRQLCYDVISQYPFLYSCSPIIVGDTGLIATFCIPDNSANLNSIAELKKACNNLGIVMKSFEAVNKSVQSYFSTYNTKTGQWDIDWTALQLETQHLATNDELLGAYPLLRETDEERIEIDDLGARILAAFEMGNRTVRELRTAVRARQKSVVELLNIFKQSGVIMNIWEVHHVGLTELVIVTTEDPQSSKIISALAARLPKSYLHFNDGTLFMRTFLPKGGAIGFAKALSVLPEAPDILLTEKPTYGHWSLAKIINLWNTRTQSWRPSLDALTDWYEQLSEICPV